MSLLTWSSSQDSGAQSWPSINQEVRFFAMTEQAESEVSNVGRDLLCEIVRDGEYAEAKKVSTPDMVWRHSALNQNFLLLSRTTPSRIQVAGEAMRGATHCFANNSDNRRRRAAIKPESFDPEPNVAMTCLHLLTLLGISKLAVSDNVEQLTGPLKERAAELRQPRVGSVPAPQHGAVSPTGNGNTTRRRRKHTEGRTTCSLTPRSISV